jgi:hypothetical protein
VILLVVLLLGAVGAAYVINTPERTPTRVLDVAPLQTEDPTVQPTTTEVPTDTAVPTDTPSTEAPTDTAVPTDTPTDRPTPTAVQNSTPTEEATNDVVVRQPLVEGRYNDRSFVLYNASEETVDVSGLVFVRETATGDTIVFRSNEWRRQASRPPERLPAEDCYQVWTIRFTLLPQPTYCGSRHAWRSVAPDEAFWISNAEGASFTVEKGGDVIATCEIAAGRCDIPVEPS